MDVWERGFTYVLWMYEAPRRESYESDCKRVLLTGSKTLVPHDRKVQIRYKFMLVIQIYPNIFDR